MLKWSFRGAGGRPCPVLRLNPKWDYMSLELSKQPFLGVSFRLQWSFRLEIK